MKLTTLNMAELMFRAATDYQYKGRWPYPSWHTASKETQATFKAMAEEVRVRIAEVILGRPFTVKEKTGEQNARTKKFGGKHRKSRADERHAIKRPDGRTRKAKGRKSGKTG